VKVTNYKAPIYAVFSVLFVTSVSYVQIISSAIFFCQTSQIYVLPWG